MYYNDNKPFAFTSKLPEIFRSDRDSYADKFGKLGEKNCEKLRSHKRPHKSNYVTFCQKNLNFYFQIKKSKLIKL